MRKGGRAANSNAEAEAAGLDPPPRRAKRARVSEPEYFAEKRNLEDLWRQMVPIGTEWEQVDKVYRYNWSFKTLEDAFEQGGILYGKRVYLFSCTESPKVPVQDLSTIPVVVAVASPFPPSDKIGITSVQRGEKIVPMKHMKMDWAPYIPLRNRDRQVERLRSSQIFTLSCTQRRAGLKNLDEDRVMKFQYCLPYFYNPLKEDKSEDETVVDILFPTEPPVVCEFDWKKLDKLGKFTDELVEDEELAADQKEAFMEFVRERVAEAQKAKQEAREARRKAVDEMSAETKAGLEAMEFHKFYPDPTPDTPDVSDNRCPTINRYYGKAHYVNGKLPETKKETGHDIWASFRKPSSTS